MQNIMSGVRQGGRNNSSRLVTGIVRAFLLSLILGLLICFDFIMYQRSGTVFGEKSSLNIPVLIACGYLFAGAASLMIITSFIKRLQSLAFALCFFILAWGFMNQFLQIDKSQYLTIIMGPYVGPELATLIDGYSHWIIASILAIISYILINRISLKGMSTLLLVLLCVDGWLFASATMLGEPQKQVKEIYTSTETDLSDNGNKLIFLFMPGAVSYTALDTNLLEDSDKNHLLRQVQLGFLMKYGFKLYPNAYMPSDNQDMNLIELVNILDNKSYEDHLLNNVGLEGLWKFKSPRKTEIFLKDNQLQDVFKKAKYKITAYQNQHFELCKKNNQFTVDRCINRANLPFDITSAGLSDMERANILFLQWVSSLDILSNSAVMGSLKIVLDRKAMKNLLLPYSQMYVVNSFDVLQRLLDDVATDKKSGVYFVYIDFPGALNVYDEWCQLKPYKSWSVVSSAARNIYLSEDRGGYNEQMLCFWGQMGDLMQKLSKLETAKNLTIVLQGLNGVSSSETSSNMTFVNNFKNSNTVLTAIRSPQAKFSVNSKICRSKDILRHYLFSAPKCKEFNGMDISSSVQETIRSQFGNYTITKGTMTKALKAYKKWLAEWKKKRRPIFKINEVFAEPEVAEKVDEDELLTEDAVNALNEKLPAEPSVDKKEDKASSEKKSDEIISEEENENVANTEDNSDKSIKLNDGIVKEEAVSDQKAPEVVENKEIKSVKSEKSAMEDLPLEHEETAVENNPNPQNAESKETSDDDNVENSDEDMDIPVTDDEEDNDTVQEEEAAVSVADDKIVSETVKTEIVETPEMVKIVETVKIVPKDEAVEPVKKKETEEVKKSVEETQSDNVSADFLLEEPDEKWDLDPAKALGVSGEESEKIIVKVK